MHFFDKYDFINISELERALENAKCYNECPRCESKNVELILSMPIPHSRKKGKIMRPFFLLVCKECGRRKNYRLWFDIFRGKNWLEN